MKTVLRAIWRVLRGVLLALAAVVLLIEEFGWRPLTAWAARLAQWPPLARLEERIRQVSPRTALLLFLAPAVMLFPIKILALWMMHAGHAMMGIATIIVVKLAGTAFVGRLFIITEPQLTTFRWFARALTWWRATQLRVKAAVKQAFATSAGWRALVRLRRRVALWLRRQSRGLR